MTRKPSIPLISIAGILVIILYCSFTLISWAFYPDPYGPLTHYLSRLGNNNYNISGAIFYNLGCILTGLALFPFFTGMKDWYLDSKAQKAVMVVGQIFGFAAGFALVMIGVFSEDMGSPHMLSSTTFFLLNFITLTIVNIALLFNPKFMKPIAVYTFGINILSLAFELWFGGPLIEWFTVFGSLIFVGLISWNSMKLG
ncbi:MAG: DUF998 domain-containing protein [Candidatus Thorarchaeota archaeon]